MPSRAHSKLIERIKNLDKVPDDATEFAEWIKAERHLEFLRENEKEEELIVYASIKSSSIFIHAVAVSADKLSPIDQDDLLQWSGNPYSPVAGYTWEGTQGDIWIDRGTFWSAAALRDARQLVFAREFKGLKGSDELYHEVLQEYLHLTDIHWRPELRAYCRFDESGDFDHVVSVTSNEDRGNVTLVSFKREPLEKYLAASNSVLVRMFDFTLFRQGEDFEFSNWPSGPDEVYRESESFFYRQNVHPGKEAFTIGVQVIGLNRPKSAIFTSMKKSWSGRNCGPYVEFIAWDKRNKRIAKISTDPDATTTNSRARGNSLPFELSIALFRPDVLLKYKGDQDKYTITSGMISCRNVWVLSRYLVNEAGQVQAYICDLRELPYKEQQHWLAYNEEPKAGISHNAIETDLMGERSLVPGPLDEVLLILREWHESDVIWWKLRRDTLLERVNTPHAGSRDEWGKAFSDLAKLVIEGFQVKQIEASLSRVGIAFGKGEKSLELIEKLIVGSGEPNGGERLSGLREVQSIRSKVFGHFGGSNADALERNALREHDTYAAHFECVCQTVAFELELVEYAFFERVPNATRH